MPIPLIPLPSVISRIRSRVQVWAAHNKVKSFVHQTDIKQGIDASYRELETCLRQFNVCPLPPESRSFPRSHRSPPRALLRSPCILMPAAEGSLWQPSANAIISNSAK